MSTRLDSHGRLIDRTSRVSFTFNGKTMQGHGGDTLASALLANGQTLVGRSFKYHRPRGIMTSGAEEPNALVNLGEGNRHEPNQRATTTELFDDLTATSQNHWPSLEFDVGEINGLVSRFLPAGFYYKTFLFPRAAWKHVFEPVIRKSAGLGRAPDPETRDPDKYEHFYAHTDLVIAGGGIAGLQAALLAGRAGAKVLLMEQSAHWGGRAPVDGVEVDGLPAEEWVSGALLELESMENVELRTRCMVAGVYDHGYVLGYERLTDHAPEADGPRHRLWRIRAEHILSATGALERPLSFAGNDKPGVMLASAVRDYLVNYGVAVGENIVVVTNHDDGYRTAIAQVEAGLKVACVVDARRTADGELPRKARELGIDVKVNSAVGMVKGLRQVTGVTLCAQDGDGAVLDEISCDAVAMSGGWSPVVHLWSHCGGKLTWDETNAFFRPDESRPPLNQNGEGFVTCVGSADGAMQASQTLENALTNTANLLQAMGKSAGEGSSASSAAEDPLAPVWVMPHGAGYKKRSKMWLDFQNDVKVSDVQLAAREGYESVEHTKRYTTLGMATDQGKLSNINGLAVLADALNEAIPRVGTTTFRPPYTPISMGAIAGEASREIFQPLRRTPMHDWHEAKGAYMEPVGGWRRPYCFPKAGESHADAVIREINATRGSLGLLDASTLGKIIVKGPDAGKLMDMMYTNMMSNLKPGKCRYGLMCSENGFLMDDGVVVRLDEDTFLAHTTSGGADHVHAHMEDWLQCEWWDWKVHTVNVTEQWAQVAVVGPNARKLLEKMGADFDLSAEALPFMGMAEGRIGGFDTRVFRISFSGELSYEIAVPASQGMAFWEALHEAGAEWDATPYGTEALHVMRAEKGFIMIGDETDGTVIPQDLGLNWAISKKKEDFLGKRGQQRTYMTDPKRWKLVGLETLDKSVLPDGAYAVAEGTNANGQANVEGRVTSTYYSPTVERGIAMGLVLDGPDRMGEVVKFNKVDGSTVAAKIVNPVFFDPKGEKQNV
ncbi:sarcosine oxidase subunit alpha family protein [Gymnodinialimonas ceratoperidinii]|uniref:Sarcosine oxidase subunit alpha family protein n=1 Tax=Gymnodinialimonas ceratoperidinii TaxID=2856823 RepID=A0A8F6YBL3_9RHOB|nr:sarcosine oxidase subunit alpha family protein [Gymnodinialimonas ceratoperidinii]QXT38302.1 sarcosine oxidase subunit alpha family protein [Gymnodinialimonas ceratoperidinii]